MEIADIVKKPFEDLGKLALGSILGIIPFINFVLIGFGLEIAKKPKKTPEFSVEQWILGLKSVLVGLVYAVIVGIVYIILLLVAVSIWGISSTDLVQIATVSFWGILVGVLLMLVAGPVFTRAMLALSKSGKMGDALKFSELIKKTYNAEFLGVWVVALLLGMAASLVLGLVPYVGWIFSNYVSTVMFWTYLGSNYKF